MFKDNWMSGFSLVFLCERFWPPWDENTAVRKVLVATLPEFSKWENGWMWRYLNIIRDGRLFHLVFIWPCMIYQNFAVINLQLILLQVTSVQSKLFILVLICIIYIHIRLQVSVFCVQLAGSYSHQGKGLRCLLGVQNVGDFNLNLKSEFCLFYALFN